MVEPVYKRARWAAVGLGLGGAAALQVGRALEGSLARLHAPLEPSAGFDSLADGGAVDEAWATWTQGRDVLDGPFSLWTPTSIVIVHAIVETLAVLLILGTVAALQTEPARGSGLRDQARGAWRRVVRLLHRPWGRVALAAAVLALVVNAGEWWVATCEDSCRTSLATALHWVVFAERIALVVTIALLLAPQRNRTRLRRIAGYVYWSPAILRVLLLLDVVSSACSSAGASVPSRRTWSSAGSTVSHSRGSRPWPRWPCSSAWCVPALRSRRTPSDPAPGRSRCWAWL